MKKILMLISCLFFVGCSKDTNITYEEAIKLEDTIIVDVRENVEYKDGHILEAINIPLGEIDENIDLDKDKTIIVYCRSGNRSSKAAAILTEMGYKVYDLGSIDNWKGNIVEE